MKHRLSKRFSRIPSDVLHLSSWTDDLLCSDSARCHREALLQVESETRRALSDEGGKREGAGAGEVDHDGPG